MPQKQSITFQEAIEIVESLPQNQQEDLISVLQRRMIEQKRESLVKSVREARAEYKKGNVKRGTADDLLKGQSDQVVYRGAENMTTKVKTDSKSLRFKVRIVVEKDDPGYHAYAPSLPGLHMPGDTRKEALDNAKEAAGLMLKAMIEDGDSIPIDVVIPRKENIVPNLPNQIFPSLEDIQVNL